MSNRLFAAALSCSLTAFAAPPKPVAELAATVTDDGQKSMGEVAVLAFGASPEDQKRAKKFVSALAAAKKACK